MSRAGFRFIDPQPETVEVTVDGRPHTLPAGRSLLAGLLGDGTGIDFFCAIGQCQRCRVRVNGEVDIACLREPQAGDVIETRVEGPKRY
ncbi:2Fe-2S iron-sulfur cluster-binding protein [Arhodomonas sp. AD133]|uniref:2Fe-2S iron-sulfur cluster-binding protein n=1 Tax=Arhodomonas sp. AD133 TaxID=3415009 RepID=UPI003EB7078F